MKDEELTPSVVDEQRGDHGGNIRIGCVESEAFDKPCPNKCSDEKGNQRNGVEEHEFVVAFMFSGLEDEQDVEDVGGEVGEEEADAFINPVVAQADGFRNGADIEIQSAEQLGERVAFRQRRKHQPGEEKEDGHIDNRGRTAAHPVFDELHEVIVFFRQEILNVFFHK